MNNPILPSIHVHDLLQKARIGTWAVAAMTNSLELDETARQVLNTPDALHPIPLDHFLTQLPVNHQVAFRSFLDQIQKGKPATCTLQHPSSLLSFKGFLQTEYPPVFYGTVEAIPVSPTEFPPHPTYANLENTTQDTRGEPPTPTSKNLLQSVLDASPAGIMAWRSIRDEHGQIVDFECLHTNHKGAQLAGKTEVDLRGKRLLEEFPNSKTYGLFDVCVNVVHTREIVQIEHAGNTQAGGLSWYFDTIIPLEDGFVATFLDITDRKRTEEENARLLKETQTLNEELRANEEELRQTLEKTLEINKQLADREHLNRQIIDNVNGGIAVWDRAGHYVVWNAFLEKISGKSEQELRGKHPFDAFPELFEKDLTPYYMFQRALAGETVTFPDYYAEIGGTKHWYSGVYMPFRNSQGEIIGVLNTSNLITDRKRAEEENTRLLKETQTLNEELRASEEELRQTLDNALETNEKLAASEQFNKQIVLGVNEGIVVLDKEFRYVVCNPFMEKRLGLPASELIGKRPFDVFPEVYAQNPERYQLLERALAGETIVYPDYYAPLTETTGYWSTGSFSPLQNGHGEIIGVILTVNFITERKLAEQALLQQKNQLQAFYDAAQFQMCVFEVTEEEHIFQLPNRHMVEYYGFSVEEMTGKTAKELNFLPEAVNRWFDLFKTCLETRRPMQVEYSPINPDGRPEWHFATFSPIGEGNTIAFISTDITERKQAEEAVRASEERLRLAQEATALGTWEWHLESNTLYCSDHVARIYGYEPGEFDGTYEQVTSAIHPEDTPLIQEALQNSFEKPEYRDLFHVLHRVLRPDGEWRWLEEYAKVYRNVEGIPERLLGTVRDITEARMAQLQINELLAETQQFNQELAIREEELQQALETEKRLNEELASREEELSSSEEELRQVHEQLMNNYLTLQEKELTLRRSQQIAQLGSWEFDMLTQRIFWSDEVHQIHEVPPGSVRTMEDLEALVGKETLTAIREAYSPQYELDFTFKTTTPRGNVKWVRLMGYPEKRGEEYIRITGIAHDITGFKQIEEKLRSSEEKFATAFDLSPNLLLIIRQKDSLIVEINRRTTEVMGFSKQELIGRSFDDFDFWAKPADKAQFKKMYVIQHYVEMEATLRKKDGSTFDALINTRLIEIEGESYWLNVVRDITEEKKAKQKIEQNTEELIALNKKMGEIKLMALRSVMNPHFIFNSLNSIQYFIAKNDRENAIHYLSLFSKLIRGVLSSSIKNKISLADEIELLMYYIKLELVRFDNQFDVHYDIDEDLDLENIEIPSLLIQPFVENAILHGLYNKDGKGTLRIGVHQLEGTLLFEVEDNGIGRKAAAAIKEQTLGRHQSVGMILTKERLEIINQEHAVSVEVIDLYDQGKAAGTKVKLFLKQ